MKNYKVTWKDGTVRFFQLDEKDLKVWKAFADDKDHPIASVEEGEPEPANAATGGSRRTSS